MTPMRTHERRYRYRLHAHLRKRLEKTELAPAWDGGIKGRVDRQLTKQNDEVKAKVVAESGVPISRQQEWGARMPSPKGRGRHSDRCGQAVRRPLRLLESQLSPEGLNLRATIAVRRNCRGARPLSCPSLG